MQEIQGKKDKDSLNHKAATQIDAKIKPTRDEDNEKVYTYLPPNCNDRKKGCC